MAKSKYDPKDFPLRVKGYARDGYSDKQIYQQLGIVADTFYRYIKKYPKFSEALRKGREPNNTMVEDALLSICLGGEYVEKTKKIIEVPVTTIIKTVNKDGMVVNVEKKTVKDRKTEYSETIKIIQPNANACKFWLRTKKPEVWNNEDKPAEGFKTFSEMILAYSENEKESKEEKKK